MFRTMSACGKPRSLLPVKAATTISSLSAGSLRTVPSQVSPANTTRYGVSTVSSQSGTRKVAVRASGSTAERATSFQPPSWISNVASLPSASSGARRAFSFSTPLLSVCIANMIGPSFRSGWAVTRLPDTFQSANHKRSVPPALVPRLSAQPVSRISCSAGGESGIGPLLETSARPPVSQPGSTSRETSCAPEAVSRRSVRRAKSPDDSAWSDKLASDSNAPSCYRRRIIGRSDEQASVRCHPAVQADPAYGAVAIVVERSADSHPEAGPAVSERLAGRFDAPDADARREGAAGRVDLAGQQEHVAVPARSEVLQTPFSQPPVLQRVGPVLRADPRAFDRWVELALEGRRAGAAADQRQPAGCQRQEESANDRHRAQGNRRSPPPATGAQLPVPRRARQSAMSAGIGPVASSLIR